MPMLRTCAALVAAVAMVVATALAQQQPPLRVTIDIKPGDTPTTIEPGRQGMIPVAILTTPQFDASTIDPGTIRIGPTGKEAAIFRSNIDDVDHDKDLDMLILVRVQDMGVACGDTAIRLTATTTAGLAIEGSEAVKTEGCR